MTHPGTAPHGIPTLAAQVAQAANDATNINVRIGTVTAYTAGSITVSISGSNTLLQAVYLSNYYPSLGDIVAVLKFSAAWLVMGAFSSTTTRGAPAAASRSEEHTSELQSHVTLVC